MAAEPQTFRDTCACSSHIMDEVVIFCQDDDAVNEGVDGMVMQRSDLFDLRFQNFLDVRQCLPRAFRQLCEGFRLNIPWKQACKETVKCHIGNKIILLIQDKGLHLA